MAIVLAGACRRLDPLLEPAPELARVTLPTRLIHGRGDRLIPFTEGLRLMAGLPEIARESLTITGLIAHSINEAPASPWDTVREGMTMFGALRGVINTV